MYIYIFKPNYTIGLACEDQLLTHWTLYVAITCFIIVKSIIAKSIICFMKSVYIFLSNTYTTCFDTISPKCLKYICCLCMSGDLRRVVCGVSFLFELIEVEMSVWGSYIHVTFSVMTKWISIEQNVCWVSLLGLLAMIKVFSPSTLNWGGTIRLCAFGSASRTGPLSMMDKWWWRYAVTSMPHACDIPVILSFTNQ